MPQQPELHEMPKDDLVIGLHKKHGEKTFPNPKEIRPLLDTDSPDIAYKPIGKAKPSIAPPTGKERMNINPPREDENAGIDPHEIRSFKKGTDYVPETGPAILHEGEAVIPKEKNVATEKKPKHNVSLYRAMHHLNKGGLHRALHVPEDENIPQEKLEAAKHSKNEHVAHMANFAHTMAGFKKK